MTSRPAYSALDMKNLAEHFTMIRVLGKSGFGTVTLGKSRQNGQVCISHQNGQLDMRDNAPCDPET
jgi:hypothetical protein